MLIVYMIAWLLIGIIIYFQLDNKIRALIPISFLVLSDVGLLFIYLGGSNNENPMVRLGFNIFIINLILMFVTLAIIIYLDYRKENDND